MSKNYSIHKAAAVIIVDRKLLVEKSVGKDFFVAPGGKLEQNESSLQALVRELKEELTITVIEENCNFVESYYAAAANTPEKNLRMDVYLVSSWGGEIKANEGQEIAWIDSSNQLNLPIGSIFKNDVIPLLLDKGLID